MTRFLLAATTLALALPAQAHEAAGLPHMNPHGAEALAVIAALSAGLLLWRLSGR